MAGFDAREWLAQVSEASALVRSEEALARARRDSLASVPHASSGVVVASGSVSDPMARVDALIDAESASATSLASARAEVETARRAFRAMRGHAGPVSEAGVVLELVHVDGMSVPTAAASLGMPRSTARRRYDLGVDWLDANGPAGVASGRASALVAAC